jgi:transcriptional regulator with XRE-family HTH domain
MPDSKQIATQVGERLRSLRIRRGLSLHDVEVKSGGRLRASAVRTYEFGQRNLTVPKLYELAEFYGVPVTSLLPSSREDNDLAGMAAEIAAMIERRAQIISGAREARGG